MKPKIILTIHGVMYCRKKKNDWQKQFQEYCKPDQPLAEVVNYKYGYLPGIISYLMPWGLRLKFQGFLSKHYIGRFVKFMKRLRDEHPGVELNIVAHSFGGWMVERMLEQTDIEFGSIIFMHCPISSRIENTNFRVWLESGRIKEVHAWSSKKDEVIGFIALPPFGKNGYYGFIKGHEDIYKPEYKPYEELELFNYTTKEEHDDVLYKLDKYGDELRSQLHLPIE